MKKLKKALVAFLALASLGSLAACNGDKTVYDVDGAAKRVMVTEEKKEVTGSFNVPRTVLLNGVTYDVAWKSDNEYAKVTEVSGDASKYLIAVDYIGNQSAAQQVTLTATISASGAKETVDKTIKFTIPRFVVNTIAEADAAKDGDTLTLEGVVVTKEAYNKTGANVYLMCDDGGFEAYPLACTEDQYKNELKEGTSVYVSGTRSYYNGLRELKTCSYNLVPNKEVKTLTAEDLTSKITDGTGIDKSKQCHLAKFTDVEIVSIDTPDSSGQYSIYVGDPTDKNKQAIVRISKYFFTGKSTTDYALKDLNLVAGQKITVTGFVGWYNNPQLTPVKAEDVVAGEINYASGLASAYATAAKTSIGAQTVPLKTIVLPSRLKDVNLSGESYEAYTIEWTSESELVEFKTAEIAAVEAVEAQEATETTPAVAAVEAEAAYTQWKVVTAQPEEDTDVTITLNIKNADGEVVATRNVTFKLLSKVEYNTHAEYVAAAKDTELYVKGTIAFIKEKDNKTIYLQDDDGNGYYLFFPAAQSGEWLEVGNVIGVFGKVSPYQGMQELANCVYIETIGTEKKAVTVTDYTETFTTTDFNSLEVADQCKVVKFNGVVKSVASGTFVVTVGEKDVNVYAGNAKTLPTFVAGDKVSVTGLLGVNVKTSGDTTTTTYQVILVNTADMIENMTDADKAASVATSIQNEFSSDVYKETTTIDIPVKYDATVTLAEDLAAGSVVAFSAETKKVTITPTNTLAEVTLKLKVTVGEAEQTVELPIKAQLSQVGLTKTINYSLDASKTLSPTAEPSDYTVDYAQLLGLDTTIFDIKFDKQKSSDIALYKDSIRIYWNAEGGGKMTISATGYVIDAIEITYDTSKTGAIAEVNGTSYDAVSSANNSQKIEFETSVDTVTIVNKSTASAQLRIKSIKVTYSIVES